MHVKTYLQEASEIALNLPTALIERMADSLAKLRGRLYVIGLGGSMANAIHFAADLRKLCRIDAEAFDNIAELTARANDDGFHTIFADWLSRATRDDKLMVLSVGGGTERVSQALGMALESFPGEKLGIVGPNGGDTAKFGDIVVKVPVENWKRVTPHTEAFHMVIAHCLVSHPKLQKEPTKW